MRQRTELMTFSPRYDRVDNEIVIETKLTMRTYRKLKRYFEPRLLIDDDGAFVEKAIDEGLMFYDHDTGHFSITTRTEELLSVIDFNKMYMGSADYLSSRVLSPERFHQLQELLLRQPYYVLHGDELNFQSLNLPEGKTNSEGNAVYKDKKELSEGMNLAYDFDQMYQCGGDRLEYNIIENHLIHLYAVSSDGERVLEHVHIMKG